MVNGTSSINNNRNVFQYYNATPGSSRGAGGGDARTFTQPSSSTAATDGYPPQLMENNLPSWSTNPSQEPPPYPSLAQTLREKIFDDRTDHQNAKAIVSFADDQEDMHPDKVLSNLPDHLRLPTFLEYIRSGKRYISLLQRSEFGCKLLDEKRIEMLPLYRNSDENTKSQVRQELSLIADRMITLAEANKPELKKEALTKLYEVATKSNFPVLRYAVLSVIASHFPQLEKSKAHAVEILKREFNGVVGAGANIPANVPDNEAQTHWRTNALLDMLDKDSLGGAKSADTANEMVEVWHKQMTAPGLTPDQKHRLAVAMIRALADINPRPGLHRRHEPQSRAIKYVLSILDGSGATLGMTAKQVAELAVEVEKVLPHIDDTKRLPALATSGLFGMPTDMRPSNRVRLRQAMDQARKPPLLDYTRGDDLSNIGDHFGRRTELWTATFVNFSSYDRDEQASLLSDFMNQTNMLIEGISVRGPNSSLVAENAFNNIAPTYVALANALPHLKLQKDLYNAITCLKDYIYPKQTDKKPAIDKVTFDAINVPVDKQEGLSPGNQRAFPIQTYEDWSAPPAYQPPINPALFD